MSAETPILIGVGWQRTTYKDRTEVPSSFTSPGCLVSGLSGQCAESRIGETLEAFGFFSYLDSN